jgi:hypothetical protein
MEASPTRPFSNKHFAFQLKIDDGRTNKWVIAKKVTTIAAVALCAIALLATTMAFVVGLYFSAPLVFAILLIASIVLLPSSLLLIMLAENVNIFANKEIFDSMETDARKINSIDELIQSDKFNDVCKARFIGQTTDTKIVLEILTRDNISNKFKKALKEQHRLILQTKPPQEIDKILKLDGIENLNLADFVMTSKEFEEASKNPPSTATTPKEKYFLHHFRDAL